MGAAGIASGDTVYIGAGVYRETVIAAMTSATVETLVIGDVTGEFTGDAGDVIWTAYTTNDKTVPAAAILFNPSGRDFLTFKNIQMFGGDAAPVFYFGFNGCTNLKLQNCLIVAGRAGACVSGNPIVDVAANWTLDACVFVSAHTAGCVAFACPTSAIADYDTNILIKNCVFFGSAGNCIQLSGTGANSFKGGGVDVFNNFFYGGARSMTVVDANVASTGSGQSTFYNNIAMWPSTVALNATTSGQIIEDYNILLAGTTRTNVTAGTHTIVSGTSQVVPYAMMLEFGQSTFVGRALRSIFSPMRNSPTLGFGAQAGGPSTDILGLTRSAGSILKGDNGIVSSATNLTLTDTSKLFPSGGFKGYSVRILTGIGSGQVKTINNNNTGMLNVDGFWTTTPTIDSTYLIYAGATATMGQATSGGALSNTRIEDANAKWGTNQWLGYTIGFASGAGASGEFISSVVSGSTATIITATGSFARNPASGDSYQLYKGSGVFFVNPSVGCYERGDTAIKETGTVRTAGTGIRIQGPGTQDFDIPVDFSATTVSVYGRYDTEYSGVLPQLIIINGEECGVSPKSGTMTVGSNTWEQLSLVVNPSGKGVITARLQSNSVTPAGATFWDDFATI